MPLNRKPLLRALDNNIVEKLKAFPKAPWIGLSNHINNLKLAFNQSEIEKSQSKNEKKNQAFFDIFIIFGYTNHLK